MTTSCFMIRRLRRAVTLLVCAAGTALAQVSYETVSTTNGTVPGYAVSSTDLLQTSLSSATRTGAAGSGNTYFYREDSGYTVDLTRLYDGQFGTAGTNSNYTVMPNNVTLTFTFNTSVNTNGYNLTAIRTFASWDDGRDGQAYTVQYATVSAPTTWVSLAQVVNFDAGSSSTASTMVAITDGSGTLASNVSAVRFVFAGYENGGTGYREFDVFGTAAIPEPATVGAILGMIALGVALRFRRWRKAGTANASERRA